MRKKKATPVGFASVVIHLEILLSRFLDDIVEAIHTKNKYTDDPFCPIVVGRQNLLRHLRKVDSCLEQGVLPSAEGEVDAIVKKHPGTCDYGDWDFKYVNHRTTCLGCIN